MQEWSLYWKIYISHLTEVEFLQKNTVFSHKLLVIKVLFSRIGIFKVTF